MKVTACENCPFFDADFSECRLDRNVFWKENETPKGLHYKCPLRDGAIVVELWSKNER